MAGIWESPGGFLSKIPGAEALAGGAAAGLAGIPWSVIIPIGISALSSFFSESEGDKRDREMFELQQALRQFGLGPYSWQSQRARQMDPIVAQTLIKHLARTANWGWPAGKAMDLSFLENLNISPVSRVPAVGGGIKRTITPRMLAR